MVAGQGQDPCLEHTSPMGCSVHGVHVGLPQSPGYYNAVMLLLEFHSKRLDYLQRICSVVSLLALDQHVGGDA